MDLSTEGRSTTPLKREKATENFIAQMAISTKESLMNQSQMVKEDI